VIRGPGLAPRGRARICCRASYGGFGDVNIIEAVPVGSERRIAGRRADSSGSRLPGQHSPPTINRTAHHRALGDAAQVAGRSCQLSANTDLARRGRDRPTRAPGRLAMPATALPQRAPRQRATGFGVHQPGAAHQATSPHPPSMAALPAASAPSSTLRLPTAWSFAGRASAFTDRRSIGPEPGCASRRPGSVFEGPRRPSTRWTNRPRCNAAGWRRRASPRRLDTGNLGRGLNHRGPSTWSSCAFVM
jgi:hypothetical protein